MTFLDDFEASYKLQGVRLVSDLLSRVPPELLKRTGVDGLLFTVRHDNVLKKYNTSLHPHPSYGA
jgi:hypothetical protein